MHMNRLHAGTIQASAGVPLQDAQAAVIMIHGRGDSARGILGLADVLPVDGVAFVAPEATNNTWYPHSFLAPLEHNQPWLESALHSIGKVLTEVQAAGIPAERTVLLGFSQGACLISEYAARNPQRYGGLAVLSGGVIGPQGMERNDSGDLQGTPVFLGCSDVDFHIPVERVHETATIMENMGAEVTKRIYPGFGHAVNQDEIDHVLPMIKNLVQAS